MEPSRNEHPEIEPDIRPELGLIEGGGESTPGRANLSEVKDKAQQLNDAEKKFGVVEGGGMSTPERGDLSAVRDQEEAPNTGLYNPGGKSGAQTASVLKILKKRGPLAAILTVGFGMPTILAILFSPALILQQFAETLTGKFNDQLGALDVRSTLLLKKKYNSTLTKGTCGTTVKIHCKYRTIRANSGLAKRLENAGITIKGNDSIVPGRVKPQSFEFNGKPIKAKDLLNEARKDPDLRRALRKGYDPLYAAFSDRNAADLRTRIGIKRSSSVKPSTDKEKMNDDLKATAAGENDIPADGKKITQNDKGEWVDSDGNIYDEAEAKRLNGMIDVLNGREDLGKNFTKTAIKESVGSVLKTTALGAGAIDSACTAWTLIRVAGFAAKYYQQRMLIAYSYEFVKIAHKQKSGDATPEEISFFADKLTSTNSEGKNALDSHGNKFAAYGDLFMPGAYDTSNIKDEADVDKAAEKIMLQNETSRYVNGQVVSSSIMAKVAGMITKGDSRAVSKADSACKFTKSWKGQALVFGLAIAGAVLAIFTGGGSLTVGAIAQGAVSVAVSVAFALLQPKLIDMAKGEVIKGDENGNETGNAVVSGMGGYNAQTASASGLRPATQEAYTAYLKTANEVAAKYAEEDRTERSPFDPTSKNTFLGSVMASIMPFTSKMQTASSASIAIPSLVSSGLASLGAGQKIYAADDSSQFKECTDPEYTTDASGNKINLAADPFCNLRYATGELDTDPDDVLDYMLKNDQIVSDEDPTPLPGSEYEDFVKKCYNRQSSIGDRFTSVVDGQAESDADSEGGYQCVLGTHSPAIEHRNNMFSAFWIDSRTEDGMEEDFESANVAASTADSVAGVSFRVATFNVLHDDNNDYKNRLTKSVNALKSKSIDVAGLQEMRPTQQDLFKTSGYGGDIYDMYPTSSGKEGDNQNPDSVVVWDKSRFELVEGKQKPIRYEGGDRKVNIVKLKYIENGASGPEFYVLNTHDPTDSKATEGGNAAPDRKANTDMYYQMIQGELSDLPVVFTGDFNAKMSITASGNQPLDGKRENLAYCVLTRDDLLVHVSDAQQSKTGECPSQKDVVGRNDVDHIFINPNMKASNYGVVNRGTNGGDHEMVYSDVEIPGSGGVGAPETVTLASFNICYGKAVKGDADGLATCAKGSDYLPRLKKSVETIKKNLVEVAGLQEVRDNQWATLQQADMLGSEFDIYPKPYGPYASQNSVIWNTTKFDLVNAKTIAGYTVTSGPNPNANTQVKLRNKNTGQEFYLINMHEPVGNARASQRTQSANNRAAYVIDLAKEGTPIFLTGDFNSGYSSSSIGSHPYCILTSNTGLSDAWDVSKSRSGSCPSRTKDNPGIVDHIYMTTGLAVSGYTLTGRGVDVNGSDHRAVVATMSFPSQTTVAKVESNKLGWSNPSIKTLGTLLHRTTNPLTVLPQ